MNDRITLYIDAKDNRLHDSQRCPTLSPERRDKLQEWGRVSRYKLEAREANLPYDPCSFCFPEYLSDEGEGVEPETPPGRKGCPECGVAMTRRRMGLRVGGPLAWWCGNCGEVVPIDDDSSG